jgi:hypothetical protein
MKLHALAIIIALGIAALPGVAAAADKPSVYHVPIAEAETGSDLVIVADVARGWSDTLELRYRGAGTGSWKVAEFERTSETRYRAEIPAEVVAPPALEYYIASPGGPHFASAADPHPVQVSPPEKEVRIARELERYDHRRARIRVAGEIVDFGSRTINGETVRDDYYRLEVDFTYRVLALPLRAFRLGFTQLLGDTPADQLGDGSCPDDQCEVSAGFRVGGFAELQWRLTDVVGVDTRMLIQATPDGFGFGGRGELRFGDETRSHFALGGEAITEVGTSFFVRLGWATVPRFPMAATVALTDYPSAHRAHGVRLIYDVAYELGYGIRAGGRIGYQARDEGIGGVTSGINATVDF